MKRDFAESFRRAGWRGERTGGCWSVGVVAEGGGQKGRVAGTDVAEVSEGTAEGKPCTMGCIYTGWKAR